MLLPSSRTTADRDPTVTDSNEAPPARHYDATRHAHPPLPRDRHSRLPSDVHPRLPSSERRPLSRQDSALVALPGGWLAAIEPFAAEERPWTEIPGVQILGAILGAMLLLAAIRSMFGKK